MSVLPKFVLVVVLPFVASANAAVRRFEAVEVRKSELQISMASVDFGAVEKGQTVQQTILLTNAGDVERKVVVQTPSAPYAIAHACPTELPVNSSCEIIVSFAPVISRDSVQVISIGGFKIVLSGVGKDG